MILMILMILMDYKIVINLRSKILSDIIKFLSVPLGTRRKLSVNKDLINI